jgi:hypothetical protein
MAERHEKALGFCGAQLLLRFLRAADLAGVGRTQRTSQTARRSADTDTRKEPSRCFGRSDRSDMSNGRKLLKLVRRLSRGAECRRTRASRPVWYEGQQLHPKPKFGEPRLGQELTNDRDVLPQRPGDAIPSPIRPVVTSLRHRTGNRMLHAKIALVAGISLRRCVFRGGRHRRLRTR